MNTKYFKEDYGLVTDEDSTTENGQLFLATYIILCHYYGIIGYKSVVDIEQFDDLFEKQLELSKVSKGLYHRNPYLTDRRIMSHDNMLGIMSWSKLQNTPHRHVIWKYLWTHLFLYDNTQGKTSQLSKYLPFSPQVIFILALCGDSKFIYFLYPILLPYYMVTLILGNNRPVNDVSGKILDFISLYAVKDKPLMGYVFNYFEKRMKKDYGVDYPKQLMYHYHGRNSKEFSINELLGIGV